MLSLHRLTRKGHASSVLVQEALWSIMFWSYIPLVAFGITASAFVVKMPIEVLFMYYTILAVD